MATFRYDAYLLFNSRFLSRLGFGSTASPLNRLMLLRPATLAFAACSLLPLAAQTAPAVAPSGYDALWSHAVLLTGTKGDFFQELRITGREQFDWYSFGNGTDDRSGWGNRRSRLGLKGQFLDDFTFAAEADFNLGHPHPLYNKLSLATVAWAPDPSFILTIGRQPSRFTLDGSMSSLVLPTIDRSVVSYNIGLLDDAVPGINVEGDVGLWTYRAGLYSAGAATPSFGRFNAALFGVVSVGRHFEKAWGLDKAWLRADYFLQGEDAQNSTGTPFPFTRDHHQAASLSLQTEKGPWSLAMEVAASEGQGMQSDLKSFEFMPAYQLNADWQAVFRYTYLESKLNNGIYMVQYEGWLVPGAGDRYQEFYLGLNRYFYGHKLKWMFGLEHARMHDRASDGGSYNGWGFTSGFRVSW